MEFTEDFGNDEVYTFQAPDLEDELEFAGMRELDMWFNERDITVETRVGGMDRRLTLY